MASNDDCIPQDAVSHIFFDLHGILINPLLLQPCYEAAVGQHMAARYGGSAPMWSGAWQRIVADWDSYYADLDLTGEDGMAHLWEGHYRTTRALFRLAGIPEPDKAELTALSHELPGLLPRDCDLTYPDVKPALGKLHAARFILGIASHMLTTQAWAMLHGAGVAALFTGPVIGPDVTGRFEKDTCFFRVVVEQAGVTPGQCLFVAANPRDLAVAATARLDTLHVNRHTGDSLEMLAQKHG